MPDYTALQEKQDRMLDNWEDRESWSLSVLDNYVCKCNTCHESNLFHTVDSCRDFMRVHRGHYTWFTRMGKERVRVPNRSGVMV